MEAGVLPLPAGLALREIFAAFTAVKWRNAMKKRIISLILVLALCLSLLPTVFAADDTTATTELKGKDGIVVDSKTTANNTVWTDDNGGTATYSKGALTLENYNIDTGDIPAITVSGYLTLNLKGSNSITSSSAKGAMNVLGVYYLDIGGATYDSAPPTGTLVVDGGSNPAIGEFTRYTTLRVNNNATVTFKSTGKVIDDAEWKAVYGYSGNLELNGNATLTLKGASAGDIGTVNVKGNSKMLVYAQAGDINKGINATVTGSATANAPENAITADVDLTKNPYQVGNAVAKSLLFTKEIVYVAQITDKDNNITKYESFSDAFDAAKTLKGCTVTVIAETNPYSLPDKVYADTTDDDYVTLDLNGHSVDGYALRVGATSGHSGNLKVIDSSGGNGAIGLAVRDGGNVEFYGGVATTCLQLQYYGGTFKFYGGHIKFNANDLNNNSKATDFLPAGYAYYDYSGFGSDLGSIVKLANVDSAISAGRYLAAAPCTHGSYDGDTCEYCGTDFSGSAAKLTTASDAVTYYSSYADARSAAQGSTGSTLTLLTDAALANLESNHASGTYTINLNGQKLSSSLVFESSNANITLVNRGTTGTGTVYSGSSYVAQLDSGSPKLTIGEKDGTNNPELITEGSNIAVLLGAGTLEFFGGSIINRSYSQHFMDGSAITLQSRNATAILHDGTFTGPKAGVKIISGRLTISGGTFSASNGYGLHLDDSAGTVTCTLTGGTFHKLYSSKPLTSLLGSGYTFAADVNGENIIDLSAVTPNNGAYILNTTVYVVPHTHNFKTTTGKCACGASCQHRNVDADTGICSDCNKQVWVARVLASDGTTVIRNYDTLSAAVSAAQNTSGGTVQLLADVDLGNTMILFSGTVTLDLNGKTLTGDCPFVTVTGAQSLTLINTAATQATVSAAHVIRLDYSAAVNIGNADGTASNIQFNLGTELFTTKTDLTGCAVNIYGGIFTSTGDYAIDASNASAENNPFQLLIQGGTFTGKKAGVRLLSDNTKPTITGGTFNTSNTKTPGVSDSSGLVIYSTATNFISGGTYQGIYSYNRNSTTSLLGLLKSGYSFKQGDAWLTERQLSSGSTSLNVTVAPTPVKSLTIKINDVETSGPYVAYIGQSYTFSAETDPADATIKWYSVTSAGKQELTNPYKPTAEARFTLLCEATKDGYTLSKSFNVVVLKKTDATLDVKQDNWVYGNTAIAPTYTPIDGCTAVVTYAARGSSVFTTDVPINAGQYTVKVTIETPTTIYTGTADFEITKRPVTLSRITVFNKTYDGTKDATVNNFGTLTGKLAGDSLIYTIKAEFEDKNAGKDKTVKLAITLDESASRDNYVLSSDTQTTATAIIFQEEVAITGVTATSRAYEAGNKTVKLSGGTVSPVCTNDDLTVVLTNAKGEMKTDAVGENKPVTVTGAALGGKDKDNYFLSAQPQNVTVTITRATLTSAVNMSGYTYGDTPTTPTVTANPESGTVTYYYSTENRNQGGTQWTGSTKLNAGTYYLYAVIGETTNYASTTTAPVAFTVSPRPVTVSGIAAENKTYNGNTDASLVYTGVRFVGLVEGDTLSVTASGVFADKNAGENKTVNLTDLTLGGTSVDNYVLAENGQQSTATATINKKVISITDATVAEKVYDGKTDAQITGVSFAGLISGESLTLNTDYRITAANFNDANVDKADRVTFTAELAENANYIFANDSRTEEHTKTGVSIQKADGSAAAPTAKAGLTYSGDAQTLIDAGSSTTGEMQYKLEDGSYSTDLPAATNAGTYNVWYKVVGDVNHRDTTEQSVEATIAQAEVVVTALDKKAYVGDKAPDLNAPKLGNDYTVKGLIGEDALGGTIALSYSETPDMTKTGTFPIVASGADGGQNYMVKYVSGTLTIEVRPAGVKGYPIETGKTENGTVTVTPKDAGAGNTVTITTDPDDGYELGDLTVTDENGKKLPLTNEGDGKYSFTMPSGKVRIEARFVRETSPFRDVFQNDYYYEAVKWASAADITGGIGNGLFDPHGSCTRAQIVTFLWRAEGSPEPARMSRFADVSADAYYAKAVAWAVENGITTGTGAGTFSPDASCTRAQAVTFLWRAVGSPEPEQMSAFTDVPADAYYAKAVAWAVENGITTGTGAGTFSPDTTCTRAQIVTFLWRAEKKAKQ